MASSRWKRFAFFERRTLAVPPDVLEDLIPVVGSAQADEKKSLRALHLMAGHAGQESSVSLTVSTAALPPDTRPARITLGKPQQQQSAKDGQQEETKEGDSVTAMWTSLTACTAPEISSSTPEQQKDRRRPESSVQLPSQGQAALPPQSASSSAATTVLDGLVLAFAASKDSALVHCFDLTVRCNPPAPRLQQQDSATVVEDMDGWRGYWNPFAGRDDAQAPSAASQQQQQQPVSPAPPKGVLHIAACRIPVQGRSTRSYQHSALHVACLGPSTLQQHQIVVWEDPHLHLSCRKPLTTPTTVPQDCTVFGVSSVSSQQWNAANDGSGTVIGIVPGMVAVGTDAGVVLVYSYFVNHAARRVLRPYLRIPPPPATGMRVVSVQLSLSIDRASVFVAYNREASAAAVGTAGGGGASMSTAGICCYDVPLPTLSSQILSAPSARHDLDGRYVGSSSLVDSYQPEKQGLKVTVVRRRLAAALVEIAHCILFLQLNSGN